MSHLVYCVCVRVHVQAHMCVHMRDHARVLRVGSAGDGTLGFTYADKCSAAELSPDHVSASQPLSSSVTVLVAFFFLFKNFLLPNCTCELSIPCPKCLEPEVCEISDVFQFCSM